MSLTVLAVVFLLILVNALYVAGEFGAVGARRSRIGRLAAAGNRLAARLLPVLEDPRALDRYIAASQIGITLSSLALGAVAQAQLAPAFEPYFARWPAAAAVGAESASIVVVLIVLSTVQVVLGELVPKALALQFPTRTALATVVPLRISVKAFAWFIAVLNGSGLLILKLLGLSYTGHRHVHSPEEIELLLLESRDGGLLEPEEQARLNRALYLGLQTAGELMVPRARVSAVAIDSPLDALLVRLAESPYTRLPVYAGTLDEPVGLLHTKDLAIAYTAEGRRPPLGRLLRPIVQVPPDMPADRLLAFLRERRTHLALVVDRRKRVVGLVTLGDVLTALLGLGGRSDREAPRG
jgi:CBS domain containing-hemolysin-like protein